MTFLAMLLQGVQFLSGLRVTMESSTAIHGTNPTFHLFHREGRVWWNRVIAEVSNLAFEFCAIPKFAKFTVLQFAILRSTLCVSTAWAGWRVIESFSYYVHLLLNRWGFGWGAAFSAIAVAGGRCIRTANFTITLDRVRGSTLLDHSVG